MKQVLLLSCFIIFTYTLRAQYTTKGDLRYSNQTFTIIEGNTQNEWVKGEVDTPRSSNNQTWANENVSFNANSEGIFIIVSSGKNKVKLFALTGQMLLDGDLAQGRFFIPAKKGIYFLRVNTKSFKVICK